jgi:hypothetical protein
MSPQSSSDSNHQYQTPDSSVSGSDGEPALADDASATWSSEDDDFPGDPNSGSQETQDNPYSINQDLVDQEPSPVFRSAALSLLSGAKEANREYWRSKKVSEYVTATRSARIADG